MTVIGGPVTTFNIANRATDGTWGARDAVLRRDIRKAWNEVQREVPGI